MRANIGRQACRIDLVENVAKGSQNLFSGLAVRNDLDGLHNLTPERC